MQLEHSPQAMQSCIQELNQNPSKNEITTLAFININFYHDLASDFEKGVEEIKTIFIQDHHPYRFIDRNILRRLLELISAVDLEGTCFLDMLWIMEKITEYSYFHSILFELNVHLALLELAMKITEGESLTLVLESLKNVCWSEQMSESLITHQGIPNFLLLLEGERSNSIGQSICSILTLLFSNRSPISCRDVILSLQTLHKKRHLKSKSVNLLTKSIYFHVLREEKNELLTYLLKDDSSFIKFTRYPNLCLKLLEKLSRNTHNLSNLLDSRYFLQSIEELLRHSNAEVRLNSLTLLNHLLKKYASLMIEIQSKSGIIQRVVELLSFHGERVREQAIVFLRILAIHPSEIVRSAALEVYHAPFHFITALELKGTSTFLEFVLHQLAKIFKFQSKSKATSSKGFSSQFSKQRGNSLMQSIAATHPKLRQLIHDTLSLQRWNADQ